jgi:outer membrane protein
MVLLDRLAALPLVDSRAYSYNAPPDLHPGMECQMRQLLRAALYGSALLGLSGCFAPQPPPFDPRGMQHSQRLQALEVEPRPMRPMPQTLESPYLRVAPDRPAAAADEQPPAPPTGAVIDPEQVRRMSLQEVVRRAVASNRDVRVAGFGPAIEQTRLVESQARFDPTFFANLSYEDRQRANAGTVIQDPVNPFGPPLVLDQDETRTIGAQTGIRQLLPAGGQAELSYRMARTTVSPQRFLVDPYYEGDLVLQVTQPLLRNFGREINRANIVVSRNNQHISLLEFRRSIEEVITEIERIYWDLALAERDVIIFEDLLTRTDDTARVMFEREEPLHHVSQANASIEIRRAALIRARSRVHSLSDQLRRLMNDPEISVAGGGVILPADEPVEMPIRFDLADQIATAMTNRTELAQQQLRIDSASVVQRVARNNLLPGLNLVGSIGLQGLGERPRDALRDQTGGDFPSYGIGLQLEIPLGNRAARAIHQRSLLQRQQAIEQYANLVEQISMEVKLAVIEVETTWAEMVATRNARFAARAALDAFEERDREGLVPRDPPNVQLLLDMQLRLAEAQRGEASAIVGYNNAISRLERAKGTLLRYNNIMMEESRVAQR